MNDENTGMSPEPESPETPDETRPEDTTVLPEDTTVLPEDTIFDFHDSPVEPESRRRSSGFHPVNVGHLVMGIAFVGLTVIWALIESGAASASDLHWLLPIPWVAAGAVGLIATIPRLRGSRP
jgi:hypothetical protein